MDVKLTQLSEDDLEMVRKWRNSENVAKYMYTDEKITSDQQKNWFAAIRDRQDCQYWIIEYDGQKIGVANLVDINKTFQSCYWAFYLGDSSVRGAGIGKKVEYNVLSYVFDKMKLNKLNCEVFVENDRVIKMHEKFGFRREAYYREHCIKGDHKLDVVGLAMLQSEWNQLKHIHRQNIYGDQI